MSICGSFAFSPMPSRHLVAGFQLGDQVRETKTGLFGDGALQRADQVAGRLAFALGEGAGGGELHFQQAQAQERRAVRNGGKVVRRGKTRGYHGGGYPWASRGGVIPSSRPN